MLERAADLVLSLLAVVLFAAAVGGCSWLNKPAPPACQGDPLRKPCTCLDPRTPGCYPILNDDTMRPDAGQGETR